MQKLKHKQGLWTRSTKNETVKVKSTTYFAKKWFKIDTSFVLFQSSINKIQTILLLRKIVCQNIIVTYCQSNNYNVARSVAPFRSLPDRAFNANKSLKFTIKNSKRSTGNACMLLFPLTRLFKYSKIHSSDNFCNL